MKKIITILTVAIPQEEMDEDTSQYYTLYDSPDIIEQNAIANL